MPVALHQKRHSFAGGVLQVQGHRAEAPHQASLMATHNQITLLSTGLGEERRLRSRIRLRLSRPIRIDSSTPFILMFSVLSFLSLFLMTFYLTSSLVTPKQAVASSSASIIYTSAFLILEVRGRSLIVFSMKSSCSLMMSLSFCWNCSDLFTSLSSFFEKSFFTNIFFSTSW